MKWALLVVLFLFGREAIAQDYSDWKVRRTAYGYTASTTNDSGQEFGKACFTDSQDCYWVFTDLAGCADEGKTPAVVTATDGATHVMLHCTDVEGTKFNFISPYDSISRMTKAKGRIGIAIPMADGFFKVVRFSLSGSDAAVARAEQLVVAQQRDTTSDITL